MALEWRKKAYPFLKEWPWEFQGFPLPIEDNEISVFGPSMIALLWRILMCSILTLKSLLNSGWRAGETSWNWAFYVSGVEFLNKGLKLPFGSKKSWTGDMVPMTAHVAWLEYWGVSLSLGAYMRSFWFPTSTTQGEKENWVRQHRCWCLVSLPASKEH